MAKLDLGISLAKEVGNYLKAGSTKSILHTNPVKINKIGLSYQPNLEGDIAQFSLKSPLEEFQNYMQGVAREGKTYKPTFTDSSSAFAKYYQDIETFNLNAQLKAKTPSSGKFNILAPPRTVKLSDFIDYIYSNADNLNVSPKDYWKMVDEISLQIKKQVQANPEGVRKEFVENADRIHKWGQIFRTQHYKDGKQVLNKYYDKNMFNQALKEFTEFTEQITGKKVFVGCPSRMNFATSSLATLNTPEFYKDVDFILFGHGKNSSLITDISHPNTWRFSDNDKSIWEYIEKVCANNERGKKGLAFCCETDGLKKAGKIANEMVDKSGQKMVGIGNEVYSGCPDYGPCKIVKSGTRHIIGHRCGTKYVEGDIFGKWLKNSLDNYEYDFTPVLNANSINYNLDFHKFEV